MCNLQVTDTGRGQVTGVAGQDEQIYASLLKVSSLLFLFAPDNTPRILDQLFQLPGAVESLDARKYGPRGYRLVNDRWRVCYISIEEWQPNGLPSDKENWEFGAVRQTMDQRNDHIGILCEEFR